MTEDEWLTCEDPRRMLWHIESAASDRKMRLFGCACSRRVWHQFQDERLDRVLFGIEQFADGMIDGDALLQLHELAWQIERDDSTPGPMSCLARELAGASRVKLPSDYPDLPSHLDRGEAAAAAMGPVAKDFNEFQRQRAVERKQQTVLLRCIFGNPFRPVAFSPAWRSETVVALASAIYAERAFDRLPILADALEEAGCDHPDVLSHCRGPGPHVRGCWVVDGVLGKV
jgi:hypothetical protein